MPSLPVDPKSIRAFASEAAFEAWLAKNHDRAAEVWIKIFKKGTGKPTIDPSQAIDVALCWGWIDGIRKPLDAEAFLQRYTPRKPKSRWSQINVERVARLCKAGRMTSHGQVQVDAAKSDGRWDAAYPSSSTAQMPADFLAAVAKKPSALKAFGALNKQQTYSIFFRLHHVKSAERRAKWIAEVVTNLSHGKAPVSPARTMAKKPAPTGKPTAKKRARKPSG